MHTNFRPIFLRVRFHPTVGTSTSGQVYVGTLWNQAAPETDLPTALVASNGGCMTQAYKPVVTTIKLGANLSQHLYYTAGDLNWDTNPFCVVAAVTGLSQVPGNFSIDYVY